SQTAQTFDLENTAGEDVLLAFLLDGQQTFLDRVIGDGMDQVTQGDTRLHFALEAHQHRFRHIQRHDASGSSEGDQTGTGREGDAHREAGVRVATGADGVGQQHAVQPAVDDAVTRTQRNTTTVVDEVGQGVVGVDVDRLRIGRGVAERLHNQISGEAQARQILQLETGNRASGVLGTDGGHLRLAVGARANALDTTGLADHLLRQGVTLVAVGRGDRLAEQVAGAQAQFSAGLVGQATDNDQRNTATGADFVEQHLGLQFEGGDDFVSAVLADLAFVGVDVDGVAHVQVIAVELDRQGASIFHGVVEDGGNLGAEAEATGALVRYVGNVVAEEPQHRAGGGLAGRTGTDHVTDVGNGQALGLHGFDLLQRADDARLNRLDAVTGRLHPGLGVQRDVRTRPGIRSGGQVVGVGFAGNLEYGQADFFRNGRAVGEPFAVSPGLQDCLGILVALLGAVGHIVEGVEHQQGVLELFGGGGGQLVVVEQLYHGGDVVAALHGAQQLNGADLVQQRGSGFALGHCGQEGSLDVGSFIHSRRNAVDEQIKQEFFFASRRVLQEINQTSGLFGIKRLRHDALGGAFFNVFAIGFKHNNYPHQSVPFVTERSSSRTWDAENRDG